LKSIGLKRYGVAKVLSTTRGILWAWAILATFSISIRLAFGFPILSMKIAFVLSLIASSKLFSRSGSTKVAEIPK
jgi:hypothetical protein